MTTFFLSLGQRFGCDRRFPFIL